MATVRWRLIQINQTILDQADFFQADEFTRIAGLTAVDLSSQLFFNNLPVTWPLVDGASVTDSQVVAGNVYFHEIAGASGYYSVRFRPNSPGYWRHLLSYAAEPQILATDYDVTAEPIQATGGLRVSFVDC